jgi:hypothetical protein
VVVKGERAGFKKIVACSQQGSDKEHARGAEIWATGSSLQRQQLPIQSNRPTTPHGRGLIIQ